MTKTALLASTTTLPLSDLRIDTKANVRKTGRGADPEFIASIKANGVQLPLIVRPNGTGHVVIDGGKRLEALQALAKSGDVPKDHPVPVVIKDSTDAEARETSLTLNVVRTNMHPVDEFRAFAELHTDKTRPLDVDAIAARFGISSKIVRQRLALGALDDSILEVWRDGKINEETAQAFTLSPNKKDQARVYAKLVKTGWQGRVQAEDVKEELNVNPNDVGKYLNAIGIDAYEARGGKVTRDLFGSDHTVSDEALVKLMVDEKLAETCQQLLAAGWAWATSDIPKDTWQFGTLEGQFKPTPEEKKELDALKARAEDESLNYNETETADDAHNNLKAAIIMRAFTAKQMAKAGCFVRVAQDGSIQVEYGRTLPAKIKVETTETVDEETGETTKQTSLGKKKTKGATKGTAKLTNALNDRLTEQRRAAIKAALVAHPHGNDLAALLARVIASQIRPASRYSSAPTEVMKAYDAFADGIAPKVMNAALRKNFDAKGYFEGAPKSFCLTAITEALNADEARKVSSKKKSEIAKFAFSNVAKTGWLPRELRTAHYDGPAKKAGPAKRAAKAVRKVTTARKS